MFSHKLPWDRLPDPAVCMKVLQGAFPGSRSDCSSHPSVHMSDEAWCLLESCWTIDASRRPNLPHIRDTILVLKISHDMNSITGDSHSRSLGSGSSSSESTTKVVPTIESHPPSLFEFSSSLQPASGRTPFVRHRRKDRGGPVTRRPSPYGSNLAYPPHPVGVSTTPQMATNVSIAAGQNMISHDAPRTWPGKDGSPMLQPNLNYGQQEDQSSYANAANAANTAANGLFLLSQAHQELTKREETQRASAGPSTGQQLHARCNFTLNAYDVLD
jgi:hypothetical protein